MSEMLRVPLEEIYPQVKSGASLLVCAYDSDETCGSMRLEGSITLNDLMRRIHQVPKDQEIIFYCA